MKLFPRFSTLSGLTFLCLNGLSAKNTPTPESTPPTRPNIIFILTDDHRWDAAGFAGNPYIQTPHLDTLAARGTYFRNTYATTSISCVSRASILTGQQQMTHGIDNFNTPLSAEQQASTYPMILKSNGYYIGFIGKYGVGADKFSPAGLYDFARILKGQGKYWENNRIGTGKHLTPLQGEQICEFLETRDKSKPFCLSVSFKAPHCQDEMRTRGGEEFPFEPCDSSLYKEIVFPYPITRSDAFYTKRPDWFRFDSLKMKENEARIRWKYRFATDEMYQNTVRKYYRLITGVDRQVGVMMQELKKRGLDKNTIIIFMGDNGYYLGEHGLAGKWLADQESLRLPLFIYDPRFPGSRTVEKIALNIDIAPTILDLAGVHPNPVMEGTSLAPFVQGKLPTRWRKAFFYEHTYNPSGTHLPCSEAIVELRYKLVRYYLRDHSYYELFDLKSDPYETRNLAEDPKYDRLRQEMTRRLKSRKP